MKPKKTKNPNIHPTNFSSHGQRWKHQALLRIQKRTPAAKWRRFAETVKTTLDSPAAKYDPIKKRVRLEMPTETPGSEVKTIDELDWEAHLGHLQPLQKFETPSNREDTGWSASPDHSYETRDETAGNVKTPQPDMAVEIEHSSSFQPDSRIKAFLADLLNIRIPAVKIYANQMSHAWVKRYKADAVTYDDKILFKAGLYDPTRPRGMALLGHELTHTAQARVSAHRTSNVFQDPGAGKVPMADPIDRNDEVQALENERRVLQYFANAPSDSRTVHASSLSPTNIGGSQYAPNPPATVVSHLVSRRRSESRSVASQPPSTPTGPLRTALSNRDLSPNPAMDTAAGMTASCELSPETLQMIKDMVYQDICDRIRLDFERGG